MTAESKEACGCHSTCGAEGSPAASTFLVPAKETAARDTWVSVFQIPKMDCPSEERMIRLALESVEGLRGLDFDLPKRELRAIHTGPVAPITSRLVPLGLGASLQSSTMASAEEANASLSELDEDSTQEAGTLKLLLAINGTMFVIELIMGWIAQSTGLLADSLDMFADAAVYGMALYAVGRSVQHKLRAAHLSGWLQMILAMGALTEVGRRFVLGSEPQSMLMMSIASLALVANVSCLWLISKHRERGAHMKASWIFSSNDVLANLGVIVAGALVAWTQSPYPDLVIGLVIALVVLNGARRILALKA